MNRLPTVCRASVAALLLAAAAPAAGQPAGVDIPPYPGAEVQPMGDRALYNGHELRMYCFTTRDAPAEVLAHYRARWEGEGQIVSVQHDPDGRMAVGYLDLSDGKTRTVALMHQGSITLGFAAVTDGIPLPWSRDRSQGGPVPIHPRAEGLYSYESQERGARFKTISYSDPAGLQDNEAYFLREMGRRGYRLTRRQTGRADPNSLMLDFAAGPRKLSVTLAWVPRFERCAVFAVTNAVEPIRREDGP